MSVAERQRADGGASNVPCPRRARWLMGTALGAAGLWAMAATPATAQVAGSVVTVGAAQISGADTSNVLVTQSSAKAVIDWRSFSVEAGASVRFAQPDRASITLNRVTGGGGSRIDGSLTANGQVWLLNPNGVIVGAGGRIDAGGFLATTHALSNDDFLAGRYRFGDAAAAGAAVLNAGRIEAGEGGYAVLAGREVANAGLIEARLGTVALGAARTFTLDLAGDRLLSFAVAGDLDTLPATGAAAVTNRGVLRADGGRVLMTARAAADIVDGVVNNRGLVQATSVKLADGQIVLDGGERGTVLAGGGLDASGLGAGETGGSVAVLGDTIIVGDGATLDARGQSGGGEIRIGGGWQGESVLGHKSAVRVAVAPSATLDASAIATGDGGTVVAWSDVRDVASRTYALGTFRADGGATGGDGGRIETSGHDLVTTGVRGSAAAPHGTAGTWLFDPYDIEIVAGGSAPTLVNPGFEDGLTGWASFGQNGSTITTTSATGSSGQAFAAQEGQNFLLATAGTPNSKIGVQQSFTGEVGQGLRLYGLFLGKDYLPFGDFAVIELVGPDQQVTTLYRREIAQVGDYGTAPWQTVDHVLSASGAYTLRAYVANAHDAANSSQLGFEVSTFGGSTSTGGSFGAGPDGQLWTATADSSKIDVNQVNSLLSAGTNVHISTAGPGTQAGDITVSAAIGKTGAAAATLKLEADRSIIINQGITSTGGKLDVDLLAKTGTIDLNAAIDVRTEATSAGNITLDATAIDVAAQTALKGDAIQLKTDSLDALGNPTVQAQTSVTIAPRTLNRSIRLGQEAGEDDVLALAAILRDFIAPTLVIGDAAGTGAIDVTTNFNHQSLSATTSNVVIRSPGAGGRVDIKSNISIGSNGSWRFVAGDEIVLANSANLDVAGQLELIAGQRFTNQAGVDVLMTQGSGHWLVYSADPALSSFGGLNSGQTALWGQSFASAAAEGIGTTGNRYAFGLTPTLTVSAASRTKTYGETLSFGPGDVTVTGLVDSAQFGSVFEQDQLVGTLALTSNGAAERANVGTYSIDVVAGTFEAPLNYVVSLQPGTATVDPRALSLGLTGTAQKSYDGTPDATLVAANFSIGGALEGDEVGVAVGTASYADKNVGTGKLVTIESLELTGADATNYRVVGPVSGKIGQIDPKAITGAATVADKIYDGTTAAVGSLLLDGFIAGDDVVVGGATYSFVDKNVGARKTVDVTGAALTGADAANYTLTVGPTTAGITPKAITASVSANDKIYDGSASATGSIGLEGQVSGDDVTAAGAQFLFSDRNAGLDKTVTISGAVLSGGDAGNYTLTVPASTTADILQKMIVANATAASKTYDGTTAATGSVTLGGMIAGDEVSATGTQFAFADKNAGTSKTVNVWGSTLTGADAGNYVLSTPASTVADILQKAITAEATVASKTYDGTAAATGELALTDFVAGDDVSLSEAQFAFADKNAGIGKTVNVTGASLIGADAGNYTLTVGSATADIEKKAIAATATANDKIYDGGASATGAIELEEGNDGVLVGDDVTAVGAQFLFSDRNAGLGKMVAITGVTLSGGDADNYALAVPANTTADILQKAITANVTAQNKIYDGTTAATGELTLTGLVAGDDVSVAGGQLAFVDKHAAIGKTVDVAGAMLTGNDAGNYRLTVGTTTADIARKVLDAAAFADDKVYDGTTAVTGRVTLQGVIPEDAVAATGSVFAFADKNAGAAKLVGVSGTQLTGVDAANYDLVAPTFATATITPKAIAASAAAQSKIYDGTTGTIGSVTLNGTIAGDEVTATGAQFTFLDKNAGTAKTVNVLGASLTGADAANYTLSTPATTVADILQKVLAAKAVAATKTYDGTTAATGELTLAGVAAGDKVSVDGAQFAFADRNVGSGKTVTINGASLTGQDAGNYLLIVGSTTADIAKKAITASVSASDKIYDGTTAATGSIGLEGQVSGDDVTATGAQFLFSDRKAGFDKTVAIAGVTLSGGDAGNYALIVPASTTADILQKAITARVSAQDKIYDGTTVAIGSVALDGTIAGDVVSTRGTQFAFSDRNAGIGKTVTVSGTTLSGADAGNYALSMPATTVADILQKVLTANATAVSKTYDGSTAAGGELTLIGIVAGDKVSSTGAQFAFVDRNAGTAKTVRISGASLTGKDAGNYSLTTPVATVADILRKQAGVQAAAASKTYDGTTAATGTVSLAGLVAGDEVAAQGAQFAFADPNVGTANAVSLTGLGLAGADAGNYVLGPLPTLGANITPKLLTASLIGSVAKVYDATTAATLAAGNYNVAGFIAGEGASVGQTSGSFASPTVGGNIVVTASLAATDFTANSGTSLSNYLLPTSASGAIGSITPATLTYVATAVSRPRGNPNPALSGSVTGFVGGETPATATTGTLAFVTPAVIDSPIGSYAIDGGGLTAANYVFVQAPGNATAFRVNEAMSAASSVANVVQTVAPPAPPPTPAPAAAPTPAAPGAAATPTPTPTTSGGPAGGANAPAPAIAAVPPPPPPPPPSPPPPPPPAASGGTGGSAPPPPPGPAVESTPPSPIGDAPPPTPSDGADGGDAVLAEASAPEEEGDEPTSEKRQVVSTTVVVPGVNVEVPRPPRPVEVPGAEVAFSGSANPAQW